MEQVYLFRLQIKPSKLLKRKNRWHEKAKSKKQRSITAMRVPERAARKNNGASGP